MDNKTVKCERNVIPFTLKNMQDTYGRPVKYIHVEQSWAELKRVYMSAIEDEVTYWPTQPTGERYLNLFLKHCFDLKKQGGNFHGANPAQVANWIRQGFRSTEISEHTATRINVTEKNRFKWNEEEGEFDFQKFQMGDENFYLGMAKRKAKPGIRMEIDYSWNAQVRPETIAQYGDWVTSLISSLETSGFDMEVVLNMSGSNVWSGAGDTQLHNFLRVKEFGEVSDYTDWSALFSPGGFRQLGFIAIPLACDKIGKPCSGFLGSALGGTTWDIDYNVNDSVLKVTADRNSSREEFPSRDLTVKAMELGIL